jgi:hypothetical protein
MTLPLRDSSMKATIMIQSPSTDPELTDWLSWASESNEVPSFYKAIAEAAFCADAPNYNLLRPLLLELQRQRPIQKNEFFTLRRP